MTPTSELSETGIRRREQSASSQEYSFYNPTEGGSSEGILLYLASPSEIHTTSLRESFWSTTHELASQSVTTTLYQFEIDNSERSRVCAGLIAEFAKLPGLKTNEPNPLQFAGMLSKVIWVSNLVKEEQSALQKRLLLKEEVLQFCSEHRLFGYLQNTIKLVKQFFPFVQDITVEKDQDPETDDQWLIISATLGGNLKTALSSYNNYSRMFVKTVPWRGRTKIRFNYNLT